MSTSTLPLAGKVALITGSSKGIGAAIAKRLASDGASVAVNYVRSSGAAEVIVNTINTQGAGKAVAVKADVSSISEGKRLLDETVKAFGRIDILILNAGLMYNGQLADIDEKQFDEQFQVNVKVPLFMTQAAAPMMTAGGRIIFFSTSITKNTQVPPNYLVYAAAKGAVQQIVRVLSKDLGAKGLTVNAIAPGPVDTDLFNNGKSEQLIQFFANMHPQKRIPSPDEISPIAAFLARDESGWVNGQTIFVNGGFNV